MIRVNEVRVSDEARANVTEVLDSGQLAGGRFVVEVERLVAEACGTRFAVAVNSGTAALSLAVATKTEPDDKVIVPALTFAGTVNAVLGFDRIPFVVDVDDDGLLPETDEAAISVHLWGRPAPQATIEDAAQGLGLSVGHGAISLYGSKTGGCGEGGVFVTNDPDAADYARLIRNQGMRAQYDHVRSGLNLRLSNLQAAVAAGQIATLDQRLKARRRNAENLARIIGMPMRESVWHQFPVLVDPARRADVRARMADRGVETAIHYPVALSQMGWLDSMPCPNAERLAASVLSLPVHEHLSESDVERIGEAFVACR